MVFEGIYSNEVKAVLPDVAELIHAAIKKVDTEFSFNELYSWLINADAQLWILYTDETRTDVKAFCITQIQHNERKRIAVILLAGGADHTLWEDAIKTLEDWASDAGCLEIETHARKGFKKLYDSLGWGEKYVTFSKKLELSDG